MDRCPTRISLIACIALMLALVCPMQAADSIHQPTAAATPQSKSVHKTSHKKARRSSRRGQQRIDSQRALQIQQALVREHYLSAKPSGVWDSTTQAAMQKYQADNGWQTKTTPDSRALIKLGLGPDHQHLLNPESAMTSQPSAHGAPPTPSANETTSTRPQK